MEIFSEMLVSFVAMNIICLSLSFLICEIGIILMSSLLYGLKQIHVKSLDIEGVQSVVVDLLCSIHQNDMISGLMGICLLRGRKRISS